jgi:protease-4
VSRFDRAADDAKISGVILRINSPKIGWSKMRAFRQAISRVQAKGKKVHAYLDGADNMDFLLASACDEVVMPEAGVVMTVGVRAEITFYKKLFDMLGVKAEMLRVGEFKSAAEPYSRTEMSPEFRKEMEEILDDFYRQIITDIASSRKLPAEKVTARDRRRPADGPAGQRIRPDRPPRLRRRNRVGRSPGSMRARRSRSPATTAKRNATPISAGSPA